MDAVFFGNYIRDLRKSKKLSIRKLEQLSGVSNSYISQIERGERGIPHPEILKKLSDPLQTSYTELMYAAGYVDEAEDMSSEIESITSAINVLGDLKELINKYDDNEIIETYRHVVGGRDLTEEQVRKILSYVRFVLVSE